MFRQPPTLSAVASSAGLSSLIDPNATAGAEKSLVGGGSDTFRQCAKKQRKTPHCTSKPIFDSHFCNCTHRPAQRVLLVVYVCVATGTVLFTALAPAAAAQSISCKWPAARPHLPAWWSSEARCGPASDRCWCLRAPADPMSGYEAAQQAVPPQKREAVVYPKGILPSHTHVVG